MDRILRTSMALLAAALVACGGGGGGTTDDGEDTLDAPDTTDTTTDVVPDSEPDPEPDVEPDPEPDTTPDVEPDTEADVEPDGEDAPADTVTDGPSVGVDCGGVFCTSPEICCFDRSVDPPVESCTAADACPGAELACDGPEDCSPGEICCHGPPDWGAECATTCGGGSRIICSGDLDCPTSDPVCCPRMGGIFSVCRPTCP